MSRVDAARRRAAQLPGGTSNGPLTLPPPLEPSVDDPEAFGLEGDDHHRPPVTIPPVSTRVSPSDNAPTPEAPPRMAPPVASVPLSAPAAASTDQLLISRNHKLVVDEHMSAASREQYRELAATLHKAQTANGTKVVMIASAVGGEGKTLTAANLALTLSESYHRRVLLVDADLRHPALHLLFSIDNSSGLSDGLRASRESFPVRRLSARLSVLTSGQISSDPMADLTSDGMKRLLQHARDKYDWVVLDTPPITLMPDASLVAAIADATILVVRAEATPYDLIARAADSIGRQKIVGVVLNRASQPRSGDYSYYSGAPGPSPTGGT